MESHKKWTEHSNVAFMRGWEGRMNEKFERYPWFFKHMEAPAKVLEIGFSSSEALTYLACNGYECTGIDLPNIVARVRYPHEEIKYIAFNMDQPNAEELATLFTEEFDYVICGEVLQHVVFDENLLYAIWHYLKKGGKLLLSTECKNLVSHAFRFYNPIGIRILLETMDFDVENMTTSGQEGYIWISAIKRNL